MLSFIIGLFIGSFIGWNLSQPEWAKDIQAKITAYIKKM